MKKLMVLVALMFMCHIAHAQYFCTASGTELHYVNYDEVGQSVSTETMTVKNVVRNGSAVQASYYDKIVTTKAKNNTSYTLYNWQYDKGTTVCTEDLMYGPYIDSDSDPDKYNEAARLGLLEDRKFKGNNSFSITDEAKAGNSLADRNYQLIQGMLKHEITISGATCMGTEKVSTTAGKFDCVKISYLKRTKIVLKTSTLRVTEWYAQGFGLVKSESHDMKGKLTGKTLLVKVVK